MVAIPKITHLPILDRFYFSVFQVQDKFCNPQLCYWTQGLNPKNVTENFGSGVKGFSRRQLQTGLVISNFNKIKILCIWRKPSLELSSPILICSIIWCYQWLIIIVLRNKLALVFWVKYLRNWSIAMIPENFLVEFIPDMICLGVDCLICGVLYKVYSKTNQLISAIKVCCNFDSVRFRLFNLILLCYDWTYWYITNSSPSPLKIFLHESEFESFSAGLDSESFNYFVSY